MHPFLLLLLLSLTFIPPLSTAASPPPDLYRFTRHDLQHRNITSPPKEYIEVRRPLLFESLTPSCTLPILCYSFGNTIELPPTNTTYFPPDDCTWSNAVLHLSGDSNGSQHDRIVGVWLSGVEILRASTPHPNRDGIFWNVRKDVTKYSSILRQPGITFSVMLENVVSHVYTGVYGVNLTFLYYNVSSVGTNSAAVNASTLFLPDRSSTIRELNDEPLELNDDEPSELSDDEPSELSDDEPSELSDDEPSELNDDEPSELNDDEPSELNVDEPSKLNDDDPSGLKAIPADLIIPISASGEDGFWFKIKSKSDAVYEGIQIPLNTYRAVIEVYVSFHGDDEVWYLNPPDSYIEMNCLPTHRGHGAYREVQVKLDDNVVGSVIPFPVILPGAINPLFWDPIVSIGAFDLPSYEFELTPFLGMVLDGKVHYFGLAVVDAISFWLVDANLHLWLDDKADKVQAGAIKYSDPNSCVEREYKFDQLNGDFKIEAKRDSEFSGWVNSSAGNFTTHVRSKFEFENRIKFTNYGLDKSVKQEVKVENRVKLESTTGKTLSSIQLERKYPLEISTTSLPGSAKESYLMTTELEHSLREELKVKDRQAGGEYKSKTENRQESEGWMFVQDRDVFSGAATTSQNYKADDSFGCFSRKISASGGLIESDERKLCATASS